MPDVSISEALQSLGGGSVDEDAPDWVRDLPWTLGGTDREQSPDDPRVDVEDILMQRTGSSADQRRWQKFVQKAVQIDHDRDQRYDDYDRMADDSILASILELYNDNAFDENIDRRRTVWPSVNEERFQQSDISDAYDSASDLEDELLNLFDRILDVETKNSDWTHEVAQRGDLFVRPIFEEGEGILFVEDDIHPGDVNRVEVNGLLAGFHSPDYRRAFGGTTNKRDRHNLFGPEEWVHFRMLGPHKRTRISERNSMRTVESEDGDRSFRITAKYGRSLLEPARKAYKEWRLLNNSLILGRVSRSGRKVIVGVDVEGMPPKEATSFIEDYEEIVSEDSSIDVGNRKLDESFDPGTYNEWKVVPTFGKKGDLSTTELGGDVDIKGIADVNNALMRMFASLRVDPRRYGFGERAEGLNLGDKSMKRQSIQFARSARRLQRSMLIGYKMLALIHLQSKHETGIDPSVFDIQSAWTSTAEKVEQAEALGNMAQSMRNVVDIITGLGGGGRRGGDDGDGFKPNKEFLARWLMDFFDFQNFDIDKALGMEDDEDDQSVSEIVERRHHVRHVADFDAVTSIGRNRARLAKAMQEDDPGDYDEIEFPGQSLEERLDGLRILDADEDGKTRPVGSDGERTHGDQTSMEFGEQRSISGAGS